MLSAKPWHGRTVAFFCLAQLFLVLLGAVLIGILQQTGVRGFKSADSFGAILLGTLSFQGTTWVLIYFFLRFHGADWRDVFGLRRSRLARPLLLGLVTAVLILLVALSLQEVSVLFLQKIGFTPPEETAVALWSGANWWLTRVYLAIFAVIIAPVAEEFVFRGVLYPFVKQRGYPGFAWIGVSLLFALIHMDVAAFVPLFVLAVALTWLYERTDNLLAPITAHSLFNAVNLIVLCFRK